MEHFGLGDGRLGLDTTSGSSSDSFVWPNFGSIAADPTTSFSSQEQELQDTEQDTENQLGPPPPLPPRRIPHSSEEEDGFGEYSQPAGRGQHDGYFQETLGTRTPVAEIPSEEQQQPWTAASKIEAVAATQQEIWATTLPRRILIGICCIMCLVSTVFLIVAHSGSTRASKSSMNIFFFRMDLSNLFANQTVSGDGTSNPALASAISQTIGLHDYYQAGLWGFCQGFYASGLASCSPPRAFYWFNPLGILLDELLLQSTIDIPPRAQTVLQVVRVLSQAMFGLYFVGAILAFVLLLVSPFVLLSRWLSLPVAVLAGTTAAPLILASSIATSLAVAYRIVAASITQLHVVVTMGPAMFVMVWAATGLSAATFLAHAILGCCATSVRDIKTGSRPYVRLPPLMQAGSDEAGMEKKAGLFVSWPNFRLLERAKKIKPAKPRKPIASAPIIPSPAPPPRPAPAPYLSPLVLHPVVPSRRQDLELDMPPSHSILAGEYLE